MKYIHAEILYCNFLVSVMGNNGSFHIKIKSITLKSSTDNGLFTIHLIVWILKSMKCYYQVDMLVDIISRC